MRFSFMRAAARAVALLLLSLATFSPMVANTSVAAVSPTITPLISDWQFLAGGAAPPDQTACNAVGRRCFNPEAMHNSYDYASLLAAGNEGQGKTIAIVDSFGSATIRNDLYVFSTQFGLPVPCGANPTSPSTPDGNCAAGITPRFDILNVQGGPPASPPPPNNGPGQEAHNLWALEVSLDVEWAHATAPLANILLVTTPTAETLGVQGFQQMMNAEQYVVDHHLADVISQSFGSGEGAFQNGVADINNLRQAFVDATSPCSPPQGMAEPPIPTRSRSRTQIRFPTPVSFGQLLTPWSPLLAGLISAPTLRQGQWWIACRLQATARRVQAFAKSAGSTQAAVTVPSSRGPVSRTLSQLAARLPAVR